MKARIIALYLPQFHPIPENDEWWGPGFTEWTNVVKAKPLFRGHIQPRIPADLGFYDLRLPETREHQAKLAREAGIEGFCYYHYWFGNGRQLLERPFNEVLASGKPDFPFCLCWANHTWSNSTWQRKSGQKSNILIEQQYPGKEDDIAHFYSLLPAFMDKRYIKIDGCPVFVLWEPRDHPHVEQWIEIWRKLARQNGLPGLFLIGMTHSTLAFKQDENGKRTRVIPNLESSKDVFQDILNMGFDAVNSYGKRRGEMLKDGKYFNLVKTALRRLGLPVGRRFDYSQTVRHFFAPEDSWENVYPTILPQWDRTPRKAAWDGIYTGANPNAFEQHILHAMAVIKNKEPEHKVIFMKSWNEWGEGNYVEPDEEFGHGWLQAIRNAIDKDI
ncbi:MAG: glycoside hydrolase family 99-like domain-containing protein [Lachnospira sp.]